MVALYSRRDLPDSRPDCAVGQSHHWYMENTIVRDDDGEEWGYTEAKCGICGESYTFHCPTPFARKEEFVIRGRSDD